MAKKKTWRETGETDGDQLARRLWLEYRPEIKKSIRSKSLEVKFIIPTMNHPRVRPSGLTMAELHQWEKGFTEGFNDFIRMILESEGPLEKRQQREKAKREKEQEVERKKYYESIQAAEERQKKFHEEQELEARKLQEAEELLQRTHVSVLVVSIEDRAYLKEFLQRAGVQVLELTRSSEQCKYQITYRDSHSRWHSTSQWWIIPVPKSITLPDNLLYGVGNTFYVTDTVIQSIDRYFKWHFPDEKYIELTKLTNNLIRRGYALEDARCLARRMLRSTLVDVPASSPSGFKPPSRFKEVEVQKTETSQIEIERLHRRLKIV